MLEDYLNVLGSYKFDVEKDSPESYIATNKNGVEFLLSENEIQGTIEVEYGHNTLTLDTDNLKTVESNDLGESSEDNDYDELHDLFDYTASILADLSSSEMGYDY